MLQLTFHKAILSPREKEITIKIAQGYTIMEIAQQLYISHHTVLTHKKNVYSKTGINALSQIGAYAERKGWLINTPLMLTPITP